MKFYHQLFSGFTVYIVDFDTKKTKYSTCLISYATARHGNQYDHIAFLYSFNRQIYFILMDYIYMYNQYLKL